MKHINDTVLETFDDLCGREFRAIEINRVKSKSSFDKTNSENFHNNQFITL